MATEVPFQIVDLKQPPGVARQDLLRRRALPTGLTDHWAAALRFQPSAELLTAINVALRLGAPLLLTGEAGTGKTQVAHFVARYFGLERDQGFWQVDVRSNTTAEDLLYHFDQVAYFRSAYERREQGQAAPEPGAFVRPGKLWLALESGAPAVVLIDEIDKAPRDLPNDLLGVLDQRRFECRERGLWVEAPPGAPAPLVIITSNSERRLPEPFLRRCVFHHLELNEALLRQAVNARRADFDGLSQPHLEAALQRFLDLRALELRKRPATAELLLWLVVLAGLTAQELEPLPRVSLAQLPGLGVLVKDRDDLELLG